MDNQRTDVENPELIGGISIGSETTEDPSRGEILPSNILQQRNKKSTEIPKCVERGKEDVLRLLAAP